MHAAAIAYFFWISTSYCAARCSAERRRCSSPIVAAGVMRLGRVCAPGTAPGGGTRGGPNGGGSPWGCAGGRGGGGRGGCPLASPPPSRRRPPPLPPPPHLLCPRGAG